MAQTIINLFGVAWSYVLIFIITGVFTSIAVEAINLSLFKQGVNAHPYWIVIAVSIVFDSLLIFVFKQLFDNTEEIVLMAVINLFFPVLFYNVAGTFTVDLIFKKFKAKAMAIYDTKVNGIIGQ